MGSPAVLSGRELTVRVVAGREKVTNEDSGIYLAH